MEKQKIGITGRKDNGNSKQRREAYYTAIPSICHRHKRYGDQIEYEQEYGNRLRYLCVKKAQPVNSYAEDCHYGNKHIPYYMPAANIRIKLS